MDRKKELSQIKEILKDNPRGMTVTDISRAIRMNRHSVAKYMDMLVISGHVEMKTFGSSKVFYLARRLPMSAILNFSSDFILVLNKDQEVVNANDRFLEFEHVKKEAILNKSIIHSSFPMEFSPPIVPHIKEALDGKESVIEANLRDEHYFTIKFVPTVFDDAEKGVTIIFEDITERKKAEEALKVSEEGYRAIFEHAAVGIAHAGEDFRFIRVNKRLCDIFGYSQEELAGLTFKDLTHPDDLKDSIELVDRLLSGATSSFTTEKRYVRKDGSIVWGNLTLSSIRGPDGQVQYCIPIIEDITARKRAEEALLRAHEELEGRVQERTAELKKANEALQAEIEKSRGMEAEVTKAYHMMHDIIEKAPFGVYVVDELGGIDYVNPAMLRISGDDDRDFRNMNVFELPTYRDIGLPERIRSALNGEYFYLGPVEYTSHFGKKTSTRNFIGMPMEEGGAKKVLVFVEEVSGHSGDKNLEEKLQKSEELLHDLVDKLR